MENSLFPPSKQAKEPSHQELSSSHLISLQPSRIPQLFGQLALSYAQTKDKTGSILVSKDSWQLRQEKSSKYLRNIQRVHKWSLETSPDIEFYLINYPLPVRISAQFFKPIAKMRKLNLQFSDSSFIIKNQCLEDFIFEISHNLKLDSLSLKISGCEQVSNQTVRTVVVQIARNMIDLKMLSLHTPHRTSIGDEELELLGYEIGRHLINLQRLDLCFRDIPPVIYGISFPKYTASNMSDKGLKALGLHLGRNLINLKSLTIKVRWVKEISDKGVKSMVMSIGRYLNHLQFLCLDFMDCQSLSGSGAKAIATEVCKIFTSL